MPENRPTRRAPTRPKDDQPEEPDNKLTGPLWARAVHRFYDPGFDVRSGKSFQGAIDDFVRLDPAERSFHDTHLLYRLVMGLEGVYAVLRRIEKRLATTSSPNLAALEHLGPIRVALEEIASGQSDFVAVDSIDGDEEEEEDEDELGEDEDEDELPGDGEDPDFIYDTVPSEEPEQPRRPRRAPTAETPRPEPQRAEPARPKRPADPEREALVGDLVPASEGPRAEAGDR